MPPKLVYGKKKKAAQPTTSFANFISPDKTEAPCHAKTTNDISAPADNGWRRQLELAAEQAPVDDTVAVLEAGLGQLKLEQPQSDDIAEQKRKSRPGTATRKWVNTDEAKENKEGCYRTKSSVAQAAPDQIDATGAGRDTSVEPAPQLRRRRALESRNVYGDAATICQDIDEEMTPRITTPTSVTRSNRPRPHAKSKPVYSPRKQQQLTPDSTAEPDDIYSNYVSPLLEYSFGRKIMPFEQWSSQLEPHFEVTKIAEASFSEVYRLTTKYLTTPTREESVLKVVALKTPPNAPLPCQAQARPVRDRQRQTAKEMAERAENDQWKSEVTDILSEVQLLQNLNDIPGFTNFRDLTILQGRPSQSFANAWKLWNKSRPRGKKSEFPDPSKMLSYDDTQLWAIVEMQDAGTDCEKLMEAGGLSTVWEVWDVFWGVCLSVAKAEETCRFEHRDLHMGNICVRSSRTRANVMDVAIKDPARRKFRFAGLETTVIDYTLSRADIRFQYSRRPSSLCTNESSSTHPRTEQEVAYLDLDKDPALFEGDACEEYQYEIYRYMRSAAMYGNPLGAAPEMAPTTPRRSPRKNTHIRFDEQDKCHPFPSKLVTPDPTRAKLGGVWKQFHPKTNLVWTHFLLHKLLSNLVSSAGTPDQLPVSQLMASVEATEDPLKVRKKAVKLYSVLKRVSELLCPVALGKDESLCSVKELVVLALEERWLRVGDVAG
ncbi:hypothetical protein FB567DRAFT_536526 [Paraphoma chrysanthemicola]|uniref:non-specific serine/threonine protein kinase n=1 Tax=Paraphoma chrysanthemicola TaxID=798071 RepID=A0A8K0QXI7_9PLEO|nr:hypothetical protein FB567DRAFT_536526 [Paraphoma chrysanthemicola]